MPDSDFRAFISHEIWDAPRLVLVRLSPAADFRHMVAHFRDLIRSRPDLGAYDYVCDLTAFRGDAFVEDVRAIAEEYAPHAAREPVYTCFATRDPHFVLWARSMDDMFRGWKHLVFPSVDGCLHFLEGERRAA